MALRILRVYDMLRCRAALGCAVCDSGPTGSQGGQQKGDESLESVGLDSFAAAVADGKQGKAGLSSRRCVNSGHGGAHAITTTRLDSRPWSRINFIALCSPFQRTF
jgi:hypothetical protein